MSGSFDDRRGVHAVVPGAASVLPTGPRLLAIGAGVLLMGAYLSVFYHVVDVVGGVRWLALSVGSSLALATVFARWVPLRRGLVFGAMLLVAGVVAYLLLVPTIADGLFSVEFAVRWLSYLSGISVLEFRRVDLWAIVVAPGPVFLTWLLLLSRRYDAAAMAGGLMLGFFTLTGDAGPAITLIGMTSLLGMLGMGAVEREAGTLREVTRIGFVLALAIVAARSIRIVPGGDASTASGSSGSGGSDGPPLAGDLDNATERANIHESVSLSPTVLFTVAADVEADWRVAAYDRYTGEDWIRTGGSAGYDGPLESPPGEATRIEQTIEVERAVRTLPAAWKPIEVEGLGADDVQVTDHGGLTPSRSFDPAETFTVHSELPAVTAEQLREAGEAYPPPISERYLQLPESTPQRVHDLAEEVAGEAPTPFEAAILLRRWLTSQKGYDLSVERPPGDVVDAFLFGMDRGYCVYFASAMVVVLRAIGIPSRFVLGYTSGQPTGEDTWVVRGLDSHAWVEIYFPGHGWVSFDPTPGNDRRQARIDLLQRARAAGVLDADTEDSRDVSATSIDTEVDSISVNGTADREVVSRGNTSSLDTTPTGANVSAANLQGESGDRPTGSAAGADDSVASWLADRDRLSLLASTAGVAIGLHWLGAFEGAYRAVRLRWQRPTDSPGLDVVRAFERFELLLAHRYRARSPGETRRRYLEETVGLSDVRRTTRLIDLYERASYGSGVTRAEADEAIGIVDAFVASGR